MEKYKTMSIEEAQKFPDKSGDYSYYKNCYWAANDKNELFFYDDWRPQCNSDKRITEMIVKRKSFPGAKCVLIENVWIKYQK